MEKLKPFCRVIGCSERARGFKGVGLCSRHYQRFWEHGDVGSPDRLQAHPGAGTTKSDGYRHVKHNGIRKYEHIMVAEKALGKPLPKGVRVHHVNENRSDNRPENLVICPSAKYHALLHLRMDAVKAGFPPNYRRCSICKQYDDPAKMYVKPSGNHQRHKDCAFVSSRPAV